MNDQDQKQLGKTLWNIADQLRGAMNADDCHHCHSPILIRKNKGDIHFTASLKRGQTLQTEPVPFSDGPQSSIFHHVGHDELKGFGAVCRDEIITFPKQLVVEDLCAVSDLFLS